MKEEEPLSRSAIFIGCAGWSVGREQVASFPDTGTHLQRYATQLNCVEINSSFYRPHRRQTYMRWAESVPEGFQFCVKAPKQITHQLRLRNCDQLLEEFIDQCSGLGERLGCVLVQLPPSLTYDEAVAEEFFKALTKLYGGTVILEPRHESWSEATPLLKAFRISQAAVDPSRLSTDVAPAGADVEYWRLHGSPRIYHSAYEAPRLESLAAHIRLATGAGSSVWCIFDNTASGAALRNALDLTVSLSTND